MKHILFSLFFYCQLNAQVWIQVEDFPSSKRDDGVAVVVNDKAYFGSGLEEWNATTNFFAFDMTSHVWTSIPDMPTGTGRQYACAFAGENCFYIFGGEGNSGTFNTLLKYDILLATWNNLNSKPGNGLIGAMCMNFGGKIIISGGKYSTGISSNEVWEYSISNDTWTQKSNLPFIGRWRAGATVLNGIGYMALGRDSLGGYRKELYAYSLQNDSWIQLNNFPNIGRSYSSLSNTSTKLILFGGIDSLNKCYKDLWFYDPTQQIWMQGPDMPTVGRKGGMACTYQDVFMYSCGITETSSRLKETWLTQIPLGVENTKLDSQLKIFPIPTKEKITLTFNSTLFFENKVWFKLTNLVGQTVIPLERLDNTGTIDISTLYSGIYYLSIYSDQTKLGTQKLIKE